MEDIDKILFESFIKLNCSFCKNKFIQDLNTLSSDNVIEGVVRFLWAYNSNYKQTFPVYEMSEHATSRFRMATKLSDALKKVGIREEFKYQTFLYHSVSDIRRLFLALVDKLPEETMQPEVSLTPLEQLKLDAGSTIEKHLTNAWVPEFCRYLKMKYDGRFWHPREDQPVFTFCTCRLRKVGDRKNLCTIAGHNDENNKSILEREEFLLDFEKSQSSVDEEVKKNEKPKLPPKPSKLKLQSLQSPTNVCETNECDEYIKIIAEKEYLIEEKRRELIELRYAQVRLEEDIEFLTKKENQNDARLLQLLADSEESIPKLQKIVDEADQRRIGLQEKFFEIYNTKTAELEELKQIQGLSEISFEDEKEMNGLKRRIDECELLIKERIRIKAKLEKELRKISSNSLVPNDRSKYVIRVLEIVANVNKQNEEILKTVKSVKKLEHELKSLSGNLERTFTVVDEWLGSRSEFDSRMSRAYRLLVRMHEHCTLIKSAINERGHIHRNIDELTNQIENQNSMDSQLERILNDLMHIHQENHDLVKQIEQLN